MLSPIISNNRPMAPTRPLPDLPFEIIRRILHHRLALPPSFPSAPTCHASSSSSFGVSDDMETAWEGMPGQMGKKIGLIRKKEREDVTRAAMSLLRVCKDWKVSTKFLYHFSLTKPLCSIFVSNEW